jgi:hypothetical protein
MMPAQEDAMNPDDERIDLRQFDAPPERSWADGVRKDWRDFRNWRSWIAEDAGRGWRLIVIGVAVTALTIASIYAAPWLAGG